MLHLETLPKQVMEDIGDQIGYLLPNVFYGENGEHILKSSEIELGETFELWVLDTKQFSQTKNIEKVSIEKLAINDYCWHHQIKFNSKALAFARSRSLDKERSTYRLIELTKSEIAESIDKIFKWIVSEQGSNRFTSLSLRLLVAPTYNLYTLWLIDRDESNNKVVVTDLLERSILIPYNFYTPSDFLQALSHEESVSSIVYPKRKWFF